MIAVVDASQHPTRDDWVDAQAAACAAENGFELGPYAGREDVLGRHGTGLCCHVYARPEDLEHAMRSAP